MTMRCVLVVLAAALACTAAQAEQDPTAAAVAKVEAVADPPAEVARLEASVPPAKPEDVRSIDAIMVAIYESISGPAGNKDMSRFRSLMLPKGRLTESMAGPSTARPLSSSSGASTNSSPTPSRSSSSSHSMRPRWST